MKKRSKASKTLLFHEPESVVDKPPGAPSNYVPPTPQEILNRLRQIDNRNSAEERNKPEESRDQPVKEKSDAPKPNDILSRLKLIADGAEFAVPTSMPRIEVAQTDGVDYDALSHIEAPKQDAPLAALQKLQAIEEPDVEQVSTNDAVSMLHYDKPLGFGLCRAMNYIITHGLYIEHKGDDEQIIEYRDDHGNLIDSKTAFKYHSHVFSGSRPGTKTRLKFQIKNHAYSNRENFQVGDTPLHSASNLRNILSEKKQAFIELTGENREAIPIEKPDYEIDQTAKKQKKKKRLKLKTKKREKLMEVEENV